MSEEAINEVNAVSEVVSEVVHEPGIGELMVLPKAPLVPVQPLTRANTLYNLWQDYVRSRGPISPATHAHYNSIRQKFFGFMRGKTLSADTMMAWHNHLCTKAFKPEYGKAKKLSPQRINQINIRIRPFLKFLHRLGFVQGPIWEFIPGLQEPVRPPGKIITEEEYERLKTWMAGKQRWQLLLWLCILGYRTGMCLKDCCYLRREQVHLSETGHSFIEIYRHKTIRFGDKALCRIPVVAGTDVHQWLMKLSRVENYKRFDGINDYVHQDAPGAYECNTRRINNDVRYIFSSQNGPALCPGRTFRHFRNTLCSNLVNSGAQLALVCQITGHNNVKVLLRYLNADREALQDAMMRAYQHAEQKSGTNASHDGLVKIS